ncbi:MAG: hypothetical protein ACI9HK_003308 [Pirellulaceae bacterium]|jgi:hypothetical protein
MFAMEITRLRVVLVFLVLALDALIKPLRCGEVRLRPAYVPAALKSSPGFGDKIRWGFSPRGKDWCQDWCQIRRTGELACRSDRYAFHR